MKKVLITGADGFIGSHLTEFLIYKGYQVTALAQYNSFNNWGFLESIDYQNEVEIISGDVRDPNFCHKITKNKDIIFHLAALIAIPYSYLAPHSYVDTNISGTLNICQAALNNNVERLVHTSTSEVYGSALYVPIDEKHPLQPQSPYAASKVGADALAISYFKSFNLPVTIARPFNTYGPRQSARAIIPTIITQIAANARTIKLGDLSPTRDFNYVLDTCAGFLALAENNQTIGETINIGSSIEYSIEEVYHFIVNLMDAKVELLQDDIRLRPKSSEVTRLCCDNRKIIKLTGFKPQFTLLEGLKKTIEWFRNKENLTKYKTKIYNL